MATANFTEKARVAHVLANPLDLEHGALLDGELFPRVADLA